MQISRFFIDRPVFATVISIVIVLVGLIALPLLPVEKTPDIAPPMVMVEAQYPGASAEVIAQTVATPLEEAINGVDRMLYMTSSSSDTGMMTLMVTFEVGVDVDMATVLVQNRVATAEPLLPEEVKRYGIRTHKRSPNITMLLVFESSDGRYDDVYVSNYLNLYIKDVITRVPGVGQVEVFGAKDFGMRIWLDPEKMRARQMTVEEVLAAIRRQNIEVAAGQIGGMPSPPDQQFQWTIQTQGRLSTPAEFGEIILRTEGQGRLLRLRDVGRIELGAQNYSWSVRLRGKPAVAMAIYATPEANALRVADGVRESLSELSRSFPEGLTYQEPYDPTLFIRESFREVVLTLLTVAALVVLTVYVFLEDWRATLVPAVTIPVSLIGTLAVMLGLGMTLNTLSLFGLVLAIGIVVDDAIVVVENCSRLIEDEKLSSRQAAIKAMEQVTGPVIATTLVLLAVFTPTVLAPGITGRLYQQFAVTLSVAVCFSTLNALTLSPVLCAFVLRAQGSKKGRFFGWFDRWLKRTTTVYTGVVQRIVRRTIVVLAVFIVLAVVGLSGFGRLPTGFLPVEDEGAVFLGVRLPEGASLHRTEQVMQQVDAILSRTPGVANFASISGFSLLQGAMMTNGGTCFIRLEPWSKRRDRQLHVSAIVEGLQQQLFQIPDALCLAFQPPAIMGLGTTSGFEVQIQDRGGVGLETLARIGNDLVFEGQNDPIITQINSTFEAAVPQLYLEVDRVKVQTLEVPLENVFSALQTYLGSSYVNDFNLFGRTFKVMAQADASFRSRAEQIGRLEVRNRYGQMVPLSTLVSVRQTAGPQTVTHYNLYSSTRLTGSARPGYSSGQAIERVRQLLEEKLPPGMGYEWSGMSLQEIKAGGITIYLFLLAALFAYLFLCAQYESWTIPIAIVMAVPLGILGAAGFTWLRRMENNIYTQMGIVLLIGVVCKTSILLVEFAKQLHEEGRSIVEAAIEAARIRFRPILMTALTTALGMVPLVAAKGAGAAARQALGTTVFGGMIVATFLGVILIPVFYVAVQWTKEKAREVEKNIEEKIIHHHE
jgi:HAE1 family hydrophobic/amphiphilic exporter-1